MKIYVGNLSRDVTDEDLRAAFEPFGAVASAAVIRDRFTGESRGFAFVEMPGRPEAQAAINGLNGKELRGRRLTVSEARPKPEGARGGGDRPGSRGGGGGDRPGRPRP